jgi:hypothetical protein
LSGLLFLGAESRFSVHEPMQGKTRPILVMRLFRSAVDIGNCSSAASLRVYNSSFFTIPTTSSKM